MIRLVIRAACASPIALLLVFIALRAPRVPAWAALPTLAPSQGALTLRPDTEIGGPFGPVVSDGEHVYIAQHSRVLELDARPGHERVIVAASPPLGPRIQALAASGDLVVAASRTMKVLRREPAELVPVGELALRSFAHQAAIVGQQVWLANAGQRLLRFSLADPTQPQPLPGWAIPAPEGPVGGPTIHHMQQVDALDAPAGLASARLLLLVGWARGGPRLPTRLEVIEVDVAASVPAVVARVEILNPLVRPKMAVDGESVVVVGWGAAHALVSRGVDGLSVTNANRAGMPSGNGDVTDAMLVDGELWVVWYGTPYRWRDGSFERVATMAAVRDLLLHESRILSVGMFATGWIRYADIPATTTTHGPKVDVDYASLQAARDGVWLHTSSAAHQWAHRGQAPQPLRLVDDGPPETLHQVVESEDGRLYGLSESHVLALDADDRPNVSIRERLLHEGAHLVSPLLIAASSDTLLWRDGRGKLKLWWPATDDRPSILRAVAGGANVEHATFDNRQLWMRLIPSGLQSAIIGDGSSEPGAIVPLAGMTAPRAPVRGGIAWVGVGPDVLAIDLRQAGTPRERQLLDLPGTVRDIALGEDLLWVHWDDGVIAGLHVFDLHGDGQASEHAAMPLSASRRLLSLAGSPRVAAHGRDAWLLIDGAVQHFAIETDSTATPGPTRPPPTASATPSPERPTARILLPWLERGR